MEILSLSFSQQGQDIFLDRVIFKSRVRNGFFIEAGADDLIKDSNTLFFELERDWTGILVEPVLWEKRWFSSTKCVLFAGTKYTIFAVTKCTIFVGTLYIFFAGNRWTNCILFAGNSWTKCSPLAGKSWTKCILFAATKCSLHKNQLYSLQERPTAKCLVGPPVPWSLHPPSLCSLFSKGDLLSVEQVVDQSLSLKWWQSMGNGPGMTISPCLISLLIHWMDILLKTELNRIFLMNKESDIYRIFKATNGGWLVW